jgi:acid stress-induced BolA-like protein IbaG/YrbA
MNVYLNHNSNQSKQNNTKPTFTNTDQMTYLQNHLQAMRELFLFRIAKGDFKDITQAVVQAKQLNIQTENCHYAVTVISPEDDGNTLLSDLALCVLHDKIKNNHFAEEHLLASGLDGNNRLICIIQVAAPYADTEKLEKTLFSPSEIVLTEISAIDCNKITPLEALNQISQWQKKIQ